VNDSYSPMRVEKRRDGVTEIDDVYLIETQGETAQALALRLNGPVVVVDRIERDVAVIAAAASNPHTATQKPSATCNSRVTGWCKLPIIPACWSGARWR
jgi:3-hydroxybutyryl-CoA dehydrogenase